MTPRWTKDETSYLKRAYRLGLPTRAMSFHLGRAESAIRAKAHALRLKHGRLGKAGRGCPRGPAWNRLATRREMERLAHAPDQLSVFLAARIKRINDGKSKMVITAKTAPFDSLNFDRKRLMRARDALAREGMIIPAGTAAMQGGPSLFIVPPARRAA